MVKHKNMDINFEEKLKKLKEISLSEGEKALIHEKLVSHTGSNPVNLVKSDVRKGVEERLSIRGSLLDSFSLTTNLLVNQLKNMTALIIALVLTLSGGTSVAAEMALPGDALYPIKISLNEPVVGLFSVSKEAKTTWQERLAERRLEEVSKLVAKGDFDQEKRNDLEARLNNQIEKFASSANELSQKKGASSSELVVRLEASLMAHQDVLMAISENKNIATSTREQIVTILSSLKSNEVVIKDHREKIDSKLGKDISKSDEENNKASTTKESALGKQGAAENVLDSAKRAYLRVKEELSVETITKVDKLFVEANTVLLEGKAKIATGEFADARDSFHKVIKLANEGRVTALKNAIRNDIEDDMDKKGDSDKRGEKKDDWNKGNNASSTSIRDDERGRSDDERGNRNGTSTSRGDDEDDDEDR